MAEYVNSKIVDQNGNGRNTEFVGNIPASLPYNRGYLIAEGRISNRSFISKFGHDSTATNADIEVWDGSVVYNFAAAAETLYLSSTDNGDAQTYEIIGLDANWNPQTKTVTVSGFGTAQVAGTWIRTFRIKNTGATNNAGIIYLSTDSDTTTDGIPGPLTTVRAQITVGRNQTLMAIWSVARGQTAYLTKMYSSASLATPGATPASVEIALWVRPFGGVFQIKKMFSLTSGETTVLRYEFPLKVEQRSDVKMTANATAAAEVSAGFDAYIKTDNS